MNERAYGAVGVAAAAILIGGILVVTMPQHAENIVRLVVVTIAAAAGLHALGVNSPPAWWSSPFDRTFRPPWKRKGRDELEWIRSEMSGWRQRIDDGSALPPEVLRLLRPLIKAAIENAGADDGGTPARDNHTTLSPLASAVLAAEPAVRSRWRSVPPNPTEVAAAVHRVLDEIDRMNANLGSTRLNAHVNP